MPAPVHVAAVAAAGFLARSPAAVSRSLEVLWDLFMALATLLYEQTCPAASHARSRFGFRVLPGATCGKTPDSHEVDTWGTGSGRPWGVARAPAKRSLRAPTGPVYRPTSAALLPAA